MQAAPQHLLSLKDFSSEQISRLFSRASSLDFEAGPLSQTGRSLALLFFEPSTRTKMSFQVAGHRLGLASLVFDGRQGSSLEKGESEEDTALNVLAMKPAALVVRAGEDFPLIEFAQASSVPVINGGWGSLGHPTQALLDVFTLVREFQDLSGLRVLFVGDLKHSRVVSSHLQLLEKFKVEIGFCGPETWLRDHPGAQLFKSIEEGIAWSDAVIALRVQLERHSGSSKFSPAEYRSLYGITRKRLQILRSKGVLLHPGPINQGIEIDADVLNDSRVRILKQVSNGVVLREALLRSLLERKL